MSMTTLLRLMVLVVLFGLAAAVGAHGLVPCHPAEDAAVSTSFDGHSHGLARDAAAGGSYRFHCHLASTVTDAISPGQSRGDDQPTLVVHTAWPTPPHGTQKGSTLVVAHVRARGLPAFILFGIFRS